MVDNYSQFHTKRNQLLAQGAEKVASKSILLGFAAVKAFFNFLKEMFHALLGK